MQIQKTRPGYKLVKSLFGKHEEIPKDWDFIKLSQTCKKTTSGGTPDRSRSDYYNGDTLWVKSGELNDGYIIDSEEKITELGLEKSAAKIFPRNTVLIAMYGATIGKTAILRTEASTNQAICAIIQDGSFDSFYLQQLLISKRNILVSFGMGAGQPNINQEIIKNFHVEWAPKPQQQKIASILSNVDSLINQTQKIIEQNKRLKTGLMQKLLTKGIGHTKFKKTEIGEIPEEWRLKTISEICNKLVSGGTPSTLNPNYWDGEIPWTKGATLIEKYLTKGERFITDEGLENSSTTIIPKNNLLVTSRVSVGNLSINKIDVAINQDVTGLIIDKEQIDVEFFYWMLLIHIPKLVSISQGSTIKGFTRNEISELKIPLPPLGEQEIIALILLNSDNQIDIRNKYKFQLETLKKGLMQKLLTGQIRVKA